MEAKKAREDRLEYVKEQLDLFTHEVKQNIKEIACNVERQVGDPPRTKLEHSTNHSTPRNFNLDSGIEWEECVLNFKSNSYLNTLYFK